MGYNEGSFTGKFYIANFKCKKPESSNNILMMHPKPQKIKNKLISQNRNEEE